MKKILEIQSESGKNISLLIFEHSNEPKYTFIDVHGSFIYSKEKTARDNEDLVKYAKEKKNNYIAIDLSNNGTQKDQPLSELNFVDRIKDVETTIDFALNRYNSSIILIGSSMGGFIALNAQMNYKKYIHRIILNCSAVKLHKHIEAGIPRYQVRNWKKFGFAQVWGVPFPYSWFEEIKELDPTDILTDIQIPVLWFHGTKDKTVPINYAQKAAHTNSNICLYEVKNAGHRFGEVMKKGEWISAIRDFLENKS